MGLGHFDHINQMKTLTIIALSNFTVFELASRNTITLT
jgi:hypothetical protein